MFMKVGDLTGLGLQQGFLGRLGDLANSAKALARRLSDAVSQPLAGLASVVAGPVVQPSLGDLTAAGLVLPVPVPGQRAASGLGAVRSPIGAQITNNIAVQAADDPEQTARVVLRSIALANLT
ncbi:hypothetical protein [Streptomyces olivaceoviridis]|uniref:hypothetical protein n=1 Tax=Streptomyces olivaceoviridis TaxID=1921 RepID=UPI0033267539